MIIDFLILQQKAGFNERGFFKSLKDKNVIIDTIKGKHKGVIKGLYADSLRNYVKLEKTKIYAYIPTNIINKIEVL